MNLPQDPAELWTRVDDYFAQQLLDEDAALRDALSGQEAAGLPGQNVSALQGQFLALLSQVQGARRILEIGTLGGYSTIWLARSLPPGGQLITLELQPARAEVARRNVARAGLAEVVEIRVGRADASLAALAEEHPPPLT